MVVVMVAMIVVAVTAVIAVAAVIVAVVTPVVTAVTREEAARQRYRQGQYQHYQAKFHGTFLGIGITPSHTEADFGLTRSYECASNFTGL